METLLWVEGKIDPKIYKESVRSFSPINTRTNVNIVWIKSFEEFKGWIERNGLPDGLTVNYNLGDTTYISPKFWAAHLNRNVSAHIFEALTGYDCIIWLVKYCIEEGKLQMPRWNIHTYNTKAKEAMKLLLVSYEKYNKNNKVKYQER